MIAPRRNRNIMIGMFTRSATALALLVILASCVVPNESTTSTSRIARVQRGMTARQVETIAGKPGNVQSQENLEAWQYFSPEIAFHRYFIVWFREGQVTEVKTTTRVIDGFRPVYETIDWTGAPGYGAKFD